MERSEFYKRVEAAALKAGIKQSRLDSNIETTYLPPVGKFVDFKTANDGEPTAHIRLVTDSGHSISVGTLRALAFNGTKDEAPFRQVEKESVIKGGYVLTGTSKVNPHLKGNMIEVIEELVGHPFTAKKIERVTIDMKSEKGVIIPFASEAEARKALRVKTYYEVYKKGTEPTSKDEE